MYSEIGAETLLNGLYPDLAEQWMVLCEGSFYRNYSDDAMSVDKAHGFVRVARDGFLKKLPSGYVSGENELRDGNFKSKYRALSERKRLLQEAFMPFDTYLFRLRMELNRRMGAVLERREDLVLKTFLDFDTSSENPLVARLHALVPFMREHRGDVPFIRQLLATLFGCEVRIRRDVYSEVDTTRSYIPRVRFDLMIDGLDSKGFVSLSEEIRPLCEFIRDRMMPFDVECGIYVKSNDKDGAILDYNVSM